MTTRATAKCDPGRPLNDVALTISCPYCERVIRFTDIAMIRRVRIRQERIQCRLCESVWIPFPNGLDKPQRKTDSDNGGQPDATIEGKFQQLEEKVKQLQEANAERRLEPSVQQPPLGWILTLVVGVVAALASASIGSGGSASGGLTAAAINPLTWLGGLAFFKIARPKTARALKPKKQ